MSLNDHMEEEYARRHNPIWEELKTELLNHGVLSYSIFLDRNTGYLFGYVECESESRWQAIAETSICKKWWRYMRDIMPSNDDDSPVSRALNEVFFLESL